MHLRDSSISILLANAVPVAGVLWLGWDVPGILLLYWAESGVIGLVNILRIARCEPRGALSSMQTLPPLNRTASLRYHHLPGLPSAAVKLFLIPFFIVHYGVFCFAQLAAIVSLFAPAAGKLSSALPALWQDEFWIPVAALLCSHLFSYFSNFVGYKEYQRTNVMALMTQPYARILVMQITIIAGSALVMWLGSAVPMLLVLIAVKTAIDLRFHERERRRFAAVH